MPLPRRLPADPAERTATVVSHMTPGALDGVSRLIDPAGVRSGGPRGAPAAGRILADNGVAFAWQHWVATGGAQILGLTQTPKPKSEHVYLNGIEQREGVDWTRSGLNLSALAGMGAAAGDTLEVRYAYTPVIITGTPPPVLGEWIQDGDIAVPAVVLTEMLHTKGEALVDTNIADAMAAVRATVGTGNVGTPVTVYHHPSSALFLIETRTDHDDDPPLYGHARMGWLMTFTNAADMPPPVPPYTIPPGYVLEYEAAAGTPLTDVTYTGGNITAGSADYPLEALAVPGTYGPAHYLTSAEAGGLTVLQTFATSSSNVALNVTVPWVDGGASLMLVHRPWRLGTTWHVGGTVAFGQYNLRTAITRGAWSYRPARYRYVPE